MIDPSTRNYQSDGIAHTRYFAELIFRTRFAIKGFTLNNIEFILPIVPVRDLMDDGTELWKSVGRPTGGIVLRGATGSPTHERILAFGRLVGEVRKPAVGVDKTSHEFVHDVTPRSEGLRDKRGILLKSSTFDAIPLRTDGYNADHPPRTVVLQVAVPGRDDTTLVALTGETASTLRPLSIALLGQPVYPITIGTTRLLWWEDEWFMRFNYYELAIHMRRGHNCNLVEPRHVGALSELVEVLDYQESLSHNRIKLQRGDVLILDNHRTLHGRLALAPHDRGRLLHRVWCY